MKGQRMKGLKPASELASVGRFVMGILALGAAVFFLIELVQLVDAPRALVYLFTVFVCGFFYVVLGVDVDEDVDE